MAEYAMSNVIPYLISFTVPLSVAAGMLLAGGWTLITPLFVFGLLPVLDWWVGAGLAGATRPGRGAPDAEFSTLLYLHVPVQYGLLFAGCWIASRDSTGGLELLGLAVSMGIASGAIAINVAHELIHRARPFEQFLGRLLLLSSCYLHFAIEHIRGHHRYVGTDRDPASARLGETFWAFYPRTVAGSLWSAWGLERERLEVLGLPVFCRQNAMLGFGAATAGLAATIALLFGPAGLCFYVASSVVGFSLLEVVNYVEHYGLRRSTDDSGRREPVDWQHSWNVDWRLGRWVLFELTRHSDHHMHASKPYEQLEYSPAGPLLPAGYPAMILLALVPPLWHRVMDSRAMEVLERAGSRSASQNLAR